MRIRAQREREYSENENESTARMRVQRELGRERSRLLPSLPRLFNWISCQDAVPSTTPRHAWAVPVVEAIHRILQRSPGKQAKFDHLFEIIHCSLVPSRQPLQSATDENPVRYLLRSALLFLCQHPVDQPMVQPNSSLNHHGEHMTSSAFTYVLSHDV